MVGDMSICVCGHYPRQHSATEGHCYHCDCTRFSSSTAAQIEVFARWYGYPSVYCQASTPAYQYVVAIPRFPYNIPEVFKKELCKQSGDGDPYFVFEYSDQFLDVAGTFDLPRNHNESWQQCYLIVRPEGGLMFKNEPWK